MTLVTRRRDRDLIDLAHAVLEQASVFTPAERERVLKLLEIGRDVATLDAHAVHHGDLLSAAERAGVTFVAQGPGFGNHTVARLTGAEVRRLLLDEEAFWASYWELPLMTYRSWVAFVGEEGRCRGKNRKGDPCGNYGGNGAHEQRNLESLGPRGFDPGRSDRCPFHEEHS